MRPEATQSLLQVPLFRQLDEREQSLLQSMVRVRRYRVRRVVYNQGDVSDALFFIVSGYVKSGRLGSTGRPPLTTVCGPGEIVGEMSLLDGGRRGSTVSVLEDAELLVISRELMTRLLESSPALARSMLQLTARRFRSLTDRFESLSSLGVPERLAGAVLKLAKKYGSASPNGEVTIPIRLSQQDLGSLVGTCRETVNKMLRLWTERRLIRQESGRIVINDLCQFQHFSESGARSQRGAHPTLGETESPLAPMQNRECG
jgi:CRP/FNR family transcriptional regulator, cyclic AMP receptor protein